MLSDRQLIDSNIMNHFAQDPDGNMVFKYEVTVHETDNTQQFWEMPVW